jgi:hypothetical protein
MPGSEIEYIDSVNRASGATGQRIDPPVVRGSWFSTCLRVAGWLVVAAAIAVAIGLAVTYRSTHGDPMRATSTGYVSERGVPPVADLVLGTVGVALGLFLVAAGQLLDDSANMVGQLSAVRLLLTEQRDERDVSGSPGR